MWDIIDRIERNNKYLLRSLCCVLSSLSILLSRRQAPLIHFPETLPLFSFNHYKMVALSNSFLLSTPPSLHSSSGSSLKSADQSASSKLAFIPRSRGKLSSCRRPLIIQARYSDGGSPSSGSIFVGGFVLGGVVIGALGCIFAPQISKALAETDKKDLMRKLPKFIYDEEKELEKQRKILGDKIAQLNDAIDEISTQLRSGDAQNGVAVNLDEVESLP